MKNIFEQLMEEHDQVSEVIEQLLETDDGDVTTRERLFGQLKQMLLPHAKAEESQFYQRVRTLDESIETEIEDDIHEHNAIEEAIQKLGQTSFDDERWRELLEDLRDCVDHHVDDEENELFPEVEEYLSAEQARQMAEDYRSEKARLLQRMFGAEYMAAPEEEPEEEIDEEPAPREVAGDQPQPTATGIDAGVRARMVDDDQPEDEYSRMSKDELYQRAKERDIRGRSKMTKSQLIDHLRQQ